MNRFLIECSIFFAILLVLNFYILEKPLYYVLSFPEFEELKTILNNKVDIILLGDSVNKYADFLDTDRRSIGEMLDTEMPELRIKGISHAAYHLGVFYSFLKKILQYEEKPKIIVPINLRSFSPEWNLRPSYQFVRERNILEYGIFYPFFSSYEEESDIEFSDFPVYKRNTLVGTVNDYTKISKDTLVELKKGFLYHYLQPINKTHKKLTALIDMLDLIKKEGLEVYFYITPIDYEYGSELIGEQLFNEILSTNISMIKNSFKDSSIEVLDLSRFLEHSEFSYGLRPNEHLNMYGRRKVANAIATHLQEEFNEL